MLRIALSVVASYVAMVVPILLFFLALAAGGVFGPDPQATPLPPSTVWIVAIVAVGLVAAVGAGYLCALLAKRDHGKAILSLITLILLMWVFSAFSQNAEPLLMRVGNLITGVAGILMGWSLRKRRSAVTDLDAVQTR